MENSDLNKRWTYINQSSNYVLTHIWSGLVLTNNPLYLDWTNLASHKSCYADILDWPLKVLLFYWTALSVSLICLGERWETSARGTAQSIRTALRLIGGCGGWGEPIAMAIVVTGSGWCHGCCDRPSLACCHGRRWGFWAWSGGEKGKESCKMQQMEIKCS